MNWAWPTSLDQISSAFPMWLTLAAAVFFGLLTLITVVRAERSVANGALTVIALLAVGIAVAATIRGSGTTATRGAGGEARMTPASTAAIPSLACLDDLAGDMVLGVCEKAVFASAESTAAAVSYVAGQISRLTASGDAATAGKSMTPELQALRRSIEHDRYGIVAQVLQVRDHCTPTECTVFRALTDNHQIITNMDEHLYEGLVNRYATIWTAPPPAAVAAAPGIGALAGYPPSVPTGRPTNADFPSSNSIPPVSIMSPEPTAREKPAPATAAAPAARPSPAPSQSPAPAASAAKKSAAKQPPHPQPAPAAQPTQISPAPSAPAASND
ncbi:hypothetical protein [Bradyrhizobium sp. Tv2a-2]|uniref:hypothetical protein n=1 Tax=Bradyrhizobium sp. Tv2a-2 TaxID=113395 RepID=UPI00042353D4|nr:hypothetical protein [Bradyrhizobium sp. Tv2a-2]